MKQLCAEAGRNFNELEISVTFLQQPELQPQDLVELARRAENDFVGAPTGILDQSASVLCTRGHALFLDTRDLTSERSTV